MTEITLKILSELYNLGINVSQGEVMDNESAAPTTNTPQTTEPSIPQTWPGAFGAYKYSRDAVKYNLGTIIGLILLSLVVSILFGGRSGSERSGVSFIGDLINVWFSVSMVVAFLAGAKATKIEFVDSLKKGASLYLKFLGLSILTFITLAISFVLLIVPFFFVLPRVALASYFMVDRDLGPVEALKASWAETKGHSGKVWGIVGASLVMAILIIVLVGIYFLIMYSAAYAVLYLYLQKNKSVDSAASVAPAVAPAA